jgi:hypothetical protein
VFHPRVPGAGADRDLVREGWTVTANPRAVETFPRLSGRGRLSPSAGGVNR